MLARNIELKTEQRIVTQSLEVGAVRCEPIGFGGGDGEAVCRALWRIGFV
jgi:hypothetical protein